MQTFLTWLAATPVGRLRDTWRRDILLRLAVSIFLAVLLSTAAYTTYALYTLRAQADLRLQERSERLATVLSQALARPLFDINGAAVTSVVDAMRGTPEVLMLRVSGPGGPELAGFSAPKIDPRKAIAVHRDIRFQDGTRNYLVGALDIAYSRVEVERDLRRQLTQALVVNLLLALTIVTSIFLVARKVARPFADIQKSLEKLTQGKTDIQLSGIGRADQVGRLSGAVRSFRDTLTRLRDAESELRELNGDLEQKIDVRTHDLKQTMQMARDSERKVQAIIDTALDAVITMDRHGRIAGWNRQAELIFGWSRDDALGQPLDALIIPPRYREDHRRGMRHYLSGEGRGEVLDRRIEVEALRSDGSEFPIELSITRIALDGTDNFEFCGFVRDISDRREREQKLVAANVKAEAANLAKSEFLANMSHEIRTPMSAIIGMAHLALRTELSAKQHDYVSKIHRAALGLLGIINDILDFSKIEAGRLEVEEVPFFLDEVLSHVASVTSQQAADKGLEFLFDVPPTIPRHLCGDPLRLGQVLINLINNGVKFTQAGELELSCRQLDCASPGHVLLRFAVRDTGIGMAAEQKAKLFQAFSQALGSTTRQFGGTGLGLSISQQLVRLMGSTIVVDSAAGQGSTFSFDLRLKVAAVALPPGLPAALTDARVLLVDDHPLALDAMCQALRGLPLRADRASGGAEALDAVLAADAAGDPYALVLTDWLMPEVDGVALARRLDAATLSRRPVLVLVTAFGRDETLREAEASGFAGFLFKPFTHAALLQTLVSLFTPAQAAGQAAPAALPAGTARVLLVEDNPVNQQVAAELMQVRGIGVDTAGNGREALDRLAQAGPEHYDLVLVDLEMPMLDGHETTLALRRDKRFDRTPVIAMTAHALADVRERCLAEGMQDYLTKPIDPDRLYATLARWLGRPLLPAPPAQPRPRSGAGLPELAGIDTARGLRHVAGNQVLYLQLLERFRHSQRDAAETVLAALGAGRRDEARQRVHTLRGVAGNVGANAVEAAAREVEAALADGASVPPVLLNELKVALDMAVTALDARFAAGRWDDTTAGPAEETPAAAVRPAEAVAHLAGLLAGFNADSVDYFDSVKPALAAVLAPALLEQLAQQIARYDFEQAHRLLATGVLAEDAADGNGVAAPGALP
ncbi:hybrid sensor histidine kinase/response regulator [Pseudoduganella armeniaca]|uniref:Sensory/regulatory protein RpfC n=1 Tax=Pseudoduganella armeniaca TaxID=2072590 RepID=A0A2R4C9K2_9BURK|nr:response regulator [Pseudoduganella armeniaca]AVR96297.1 hybrid sensor histidine kinase/response regulator [Pseudoduganella armeniaca]